MSKLEKLLNGLLAVVGLVLAMWELLRAGNMYGLYQGIIITDGWKLFVLPLLIVVFLLLGIISVFSMKKRWGIVLLCVPIVLVLIGHRVLG